MKKIKKIQGAPAGRVKGSSQGSSLEPLRIRERRDSHGQKPPTRDFFWFFSFFGLFEKNQKNQKKYCFFYFFGFSKKSQKSKKWKKSKESRVPPQGESRAPARAPAWSHSGSGRGGIPTARNPPRGETQGPGFFSFFWFFWFFSFFGLFEKNQKNQKNFIYFFLVFLVFRKKFKKNKKIQKIQGAPAGRVKGSSQGSSLEPLRIRERRDSHGQKPPTRGDPGSRIFFIFLIFLIFFVFWPFREKSKKSKKIYWFFWFFGFSKKIKKTKKWKKSKKSRVPSQGESRAPARAPAWSHSGSGRGGIPTARNPPRGETQGFHFLIFLIFFVLWPFRKKSKKILFFLIFLLLRKKSKKNRKWKKSRVLLQGGSRAPARAPGWTHSGEARNPPPARRPRVPDFFDCFNFFGRTRVFICSASAASLHVKPARTYRT